MANVLTFEEAKRKFKDIKFDRIVHPSEMVEIYANYADGLDKKKIWLGYDGIDKAIGGVRPGQLLSIVAKPNMGKTSMAINIARNQCGTFDPDDEQILFFTLESTEEEIFERMVQIDLGIDTVTVEQNMERKNKQFMSQCDEVMDRWKGIVFVIYRIPIDELPLYVNAIELTSEKRVKLVIVDYLQILRNDKMTSEYARTTDNMQKLKEMCLALKKPTINLCTTPKEEGREMKKELDMWSGKGSGEIAGSSNLVFTLDKAKELPAELPQEMYQDIEAQKITMLKFKTGKKKQGKFGEILLINDNITTKIIEYGKQPIFIPSDNGSEEPF